MVPGFSLPELMEVLLPNGGLAVVSQGSALDGGPCARPRAAVPDTANPAGNYIQAW